MKFEEVFYMTLFINSLLSMDYKEEQANEVEALQCIFIDEFESIYNDPV